MAASVEIAASANPIGASPSKSQSKFTCLCCRIRVESAELQRLHFKTEWHLYNLKRRVCQLEPVDLQAFETVQANSPVLKPEEQDDYRYEKEADDCSEDEEEEIGEEEEFEDVDEEIDEEEAARLLANVVKEDTCLFCAKKCENVHENVEHMYHHGFYIPEEKYLSDLEGLIVYLGFKVGAGTTCLWCNKQFKSLHGTRLHMLYKDHCKVFYDHEKAVEEFSDFYDYSSQERIEMKPLSELAIPRKRSEKFYEAKQSRALALQKTSAEKHANLKQLMLKNQANLTNYYHPKYVKKFNLHRTKILLKTGMANNETMRSRLRKQNPM